MFSFTHSWWNTLRSSWGSAVTTLRTSLLSVFKKSQTGALSQEEQQTIKSLLLAADIGPKLTGELMQQLQAQITKEAKDRITLIDAYLKERLPPTQEMATDFDVLFLVGVNGSGKTTTAAKLATYVREQMGRTPYLIPADTYRAGAVDQLVTWAKRVNCPYFESTLSDPGAVIFQGIDAALAHYDRPCIIIDTSGRLQTHKNLMSELIKMKKIVERKVDISRIRTILILDGSQGQNMLQQVKIFHEALNLSSLIITKLDGSSKAGVLCQLYDSYHIGVDFVGVGEKNSDLIGYDKEAFAKALLGEAE